MAVCQDRWKDSCVGPGLVVSLINVERKCCTGSFFSEVSLWHFGQQRRPGSNNVWSLAFFFLLPSNSKTIFFSESYSSSLLQPFMIPVLPHPIFPLLSPFLCSSSISSFPLPSSQQCLRGGCWQQAGTLSGLLCGIVWLCGVLERTMEANAGPLHHPHQDWLRSGWRSVHAQVRPICL